MATVCLLCLRDNIYHYQHLSSVINPSYIRSCHSLIKGHTTTSEAVLHCWDCIFLLLCFNDHITECFSIYRFTNSFLSFYVVLLQSNDKLIYHCSQFTEIYHNLVVFKQSIKKSLTVEKLKKGRTLLIKWAQ